jgi:hypothetical protein
MAWLIIIVVCLCNDCPGLALLALLLAIFIR